MSDQRKTEKEEAACCGNRVIGGPQDNDRLSSEKQNNASFPFLLYKMLEQIETTNLSHVVSWLPDGRSFVVNDVDRFVENILPQYFPMTSMRVFLQQLYQRKFQVDNTTGVTAMRREHHAGPFYHKNFRRGQPNLLRGMITVGAIQAILSQKLSRSAAKKRRWNHHSHNIAEPQFLAMPPIRLLRCSSIQPQQPENQPGVSRILTEMRLQSSTQPLKLSFHQGTRQINQEMSSMNIFMRDAYYQVSA